MEWLNDGVGLIVVISSVIIVLLIAVVLSVLLVLRNKIAVQRLKFLGFYATDAATRSRYAECTIGNGSLNEVALSEIGIRNGKVSFNLTSLYKQKAKLTPEARIVIEQRSSLRFSLTEEELMGLLTDGKKGKELKTLRLYAVDLTGNLYQGKIKSIQKLLAEMLMGTRPSSSLFGRKTAPAEPILPAAPIEPTVPAATETVSAPAPAPETAETAETAETSTPAPETAETSTPAPETDEA